MIIQANVRAGISAVMCHFRTSSGVDEVNFGKFCLVGVEALVASWNGLSVFALMFLTFKSRLRLNPCASQVAYGQRWGCVGIVVRRCRFRGDACSVRVLRPGTHIILFLNFASVNSVNPVIFMWIDFGMIVFGVVRLVLREERYQWKLPFQAVQDYLSSKQLSMLSKSTPEKSE